MTERVGPCRPPKSTWLNSEMLPPTRRYAAIDIGSNAIRMVIAEYDYRGFHSTEKFRIPIRLGVDVFEKGKISAKNLKASARAFEKFKQLTLSRKVLRVRAVGTSALRESANQAAFIELIRRKSGIIIECIDGVEEARLVHLAVQNRLHLLGHRCLLLDIGGGSAELTLSKNGQMQATQSFPFGTLRTLEAMKKKNLKESQLYLVMDEFLAPLAHFVHAQTEKEPLHFLVGTGGNMDTLLKLREKLFKSPGEPDKRSPLTYKELSLILEKLQLMSHKDRMEQFDLRSDRADVILPALMLTVQTMRQAHTDTLVLPQVGLKDGVLWSLLEKDLSH